MSCLEVEEPENLAGVERQTGIADIGVAQDRAKQLALLLQDLVDALFDGVPADELCDQDRILLPDAMGAVDSLIFYCRVPPSVIEKHVPGKLQIEADGPDSITHEDQMSVGIVLELGQDRVTPS